MAKLPKIGNSRMYLLSDSNNKLVPIANQIAQKHYDKEEEVVIIEEYTNTQLILAKANSRGMSSIIVEYKLHLHFHFEDESTLVFIVKATA